MKAIIIVLLAIIVAILGYNFYTSWHRFHPPNYHYTPTVEVPENHADKSLLLAYYEAVEKLNGYVITQWSANSIDVRNPEDDDDATNAAVLTYASKLATVKYYEGQLTATEVKKTTSKTPSEKEKRKKLIEKMFYANQNDNAFKLGEKNALIFEVQRILIEKGETVSHDGLYRIETQTALKNFEAKNNLFPDGKLDALTLDALLK